MTMLRFIQVLFLMTLGSIATAETSGETPEITVLDYIAAYEVWNDDAVASRQRNEEFGYTAQTFGVMLKPFILPGTRIDGHRYSAVSQHQSGRDVIDRVDIHGDLAQVFTLSLDRYRFDLTKSEDRWWLTQVSFIGNDGQAMPILASTR